MIAQEHFLSTTKRFIKEFGSGHRIAGVIAGYRGDLWRDAMDALGWQRGRARFLRNRTVPNRRGETNMLNLVSAMGIAVIFAVPLAVGAADLPAVPPKDEVVCVSGTMDANGNEGEEVCFKRSDLKRAKLPPGAAQAAKAKGTRVLNYRVQAAQNNSDKPAQ